MSRYFSAVLKRKKTVVIAFVCLAVICGLMMLGVGQNYDMGKYLPDNSKAKQGIQVLQDEFSYNGTAVAMVKDNSIPDILQIKQDIEGIAGVETVIWLDDIYDIYQPIEIMDQDIVNNYLSEDAALLNIIFANDDYDKQTRAAIDEIKALFGDELLLSGSAISSFESVNAMNGSIMIGIIIALIAALAIMALATRAFFEVVLLLITIGVSILLNMGTNIVFGEISNMTFASAAILQLAISIDYSIFLLHRFDQERELTADPSKAMMKALIASKSTILASGLTTIMGFVALVFMSYQIGMDMGLVLAKGILFSLLCAMTLLPVLTVMTVKLIDKTKHRNLLPSTRRIEHLLSGKIRFVLVGALLIVGVISFMAQGNNNFTYADASSAGPDQAAIDDAIAEEFGGSNDFVLLVPRGDMVKEYEMVQRIKSLSYVDSIQGYYALINPVIPEEIIAKDIKDNFFSDNYSRLIIEVNAPIESELSFSAVEQISQIAADSYQQSFLTGSAAVVYDVKEAASGDYLKITLLSMLFVGIILVFTFRSLLLPLLLLAVIETSIWINMAIPYFQGVPMVFIGYLIIIAIQLGATIDYTILMTNYYLDGRKTMSKREAGEYASDKAGASILVSALVLAVAGLTVSFSFTQEALAQLGDLIFRGAILSGFLTIVILPQILILMDKPIAKSIWKKGRFLRRNSNEDENIVK